jgi:small subunit ribosomal protein S9
LNFSLSISQEERKSMQDNNYFWGTGRRKSALARVRVRPGNGEIKINNRAVEDYFPRLVWQSQVWQSLKTVSLEGKVDVFIRATGGGLTGQAGAAKMGIARALIKLNPDLRPALKKEGLLTRDPRMVERKKFGQKGARGKRQYSKR